MDAFAEDLHALVERSGRESMNQAQIAERIARKAHEGQKRRVADNTLHLTINYAALRWL